MYPYSSRLSFLRLTLLVALSCASVLQAESTLNFPRLSFDAATFTGVAIVNPTDQDASVTLTAYDENGQILAQVVRQVPANQQFVDVTSNLFQGIDPSTVAWFQATSPADGLTGFFLLLNAPPTTQFDGADLPAAATQIVFRQVRLDAGYSTELNIVVPDGSGAELQLSLIGGANPINQSLSLPAKGVARLDVADFFSSGPLAADVYVTVSSDVPVAGFELVRSPDGDLVGLSAADATEQLTHLYFPQVAVLGGIESSVGTINNSNKAVVLTFTVFQPDGSPYGAENLQNNPVVRNLNPGEILVLDVADLFGFAGNDLLAGWLQVTSSSAAVTGFITYGTPATGAAATVVPTQVAQSRAIFSHIETAQGFFTGLAILNAGQLAANVQVVVLTKTGEVVGSTSLVLTPGQRTSLLIDQLIPEAAGQSGGLIFLKSNFPVYASSLFGSSSGRVLANIPPQLSPEAYDPGPAPLLINPPLVVVQPGQSQPFQGAGPGAIWSVNGQEGGTAAQGTITANGTYTAPAQVPDPRVVTISAQVNGQSAVASVDVLEKETLLAGSSTVQSVAYLGSLERLYVAELQLLGAAVAPTALPAQGGADTEIFEVEGPGLPRVSVIQLDGETISQMIPFTASNGQDLLLLAAQTSGKVLRLDPNTKLTTEVASGLDQPESLVIDPVTGDLFVVEQTQVTAITRSTVEAGLISTAAVPGTGQPKLADEPIPVQGGAGIAVDRCTGNIYISNPLTNEILEFVRETGELRTYFPGISGPTRLLAVYRGRVSCPDGFQLLVLETNNNRVLLIGARASTAFGWISANGSRDLAFLPGNSPFADASEAILFTEQVNVTSVRVPDLYVNLPDNPPLPIDLGIDPLPDPDPNPDPDPGPGPSPGPGAASDCLDTSLFFTPYTSSAQYLITGPQNGTFSIDTTHTPNSSFQGQAASEFFTMTTSDVGTTGPVTAQTRSYSQLDGIDIIQLGSISDLISPFAGTSTTVNMPPYRDGRFSLQPGQTASATYTAEVTTVFEGLPPIPPISQMITITVTYLGQETVTVPGGTFDTCVFTDEATTTWLNKGNGILIKSFTPGGEGSGATTTELQSGTFNGSPIAP